MTVTFVSNYINHHQIPVSNELYAYFGNGYHFVQTEPMEEERVNMGWNNAFSEIPYLLKYYEDSEACQKVIDESDVVIFGGTENEAYIQARLRDRKPVIRYSERLYKEGQWKCISPRGLVKKYHDHTRYSDAPVYLLCSGGYVADDFNIIRAYNGKRFKWGYFPEFIEYSEEERKLRRDKRREHEKLKILWVARLIELKHPEVCIEMGKYLKNKGIDFEIVILGDGELRAKLEVDIQKYELTDNVILKGMVSTSEVRDEMNEADIFVFSSNFIEGWGAVMNEAMNAGCAVVAAHSVGSVPFLIKHRENGMVYPFGDNKKLCEIIGELSEDQKWRLSLGENAYETLLNEWNHKTASQRLIKLCEDVNKGEFHFFESGPLSEAKVIHQKKMYKYLTGMDK